jgi:regulator of sigma E protease
MSLVMLKKMLFGDIGVENLSGPVSIAQFSGQALQSGIISFLGLLGLLSLSLGILNLLPIPVLDGGHLIYYIVEMIKGSPVKESTMMIGQKIGLLLIIGLTVLALTNDILRITDG